MEAAHNVKLRGAFTHTLSGALVHFFQCESVGARGSRIAPEGAQLTMGDANVGGIDVAIDVVIGDVAVTLFPNEIGEPADS